MGKRIKILFLLVLVSFIFANPWQKVAEYKGLDVSFLFYKKANNSYNGIVLKLHNKNEYRIFYQFELVFQSKLREKTELVEGYLNPEEIITGSNYNLFFLPFKDSTTISHLGLQKIKVVQESDSD